MIKEVQYRVTQNTEDSNSFEKLQRVAGHCQTARHNLSFLEQEGIEAEQAWEGAFWKVQQAKSELFRTFEYEFQSAEPYSSPRTSSPSSRHGSPSDLASQDSENNTVQRVLPYYHPADSAASSSSFTLAHPRTELLPHGNTGISRHSAPLFERNFAISIRKLRSQPYMGL